MIAKRTRAFSPGGTRTRRARVPCSGWRQRIRFDPEADTDIVILGSSHAQLGLSAAAVEDQLALHGKRASVANLAIGGPGRTSSGRSLTSSSNRSPRK